MRNPCLIIILFKLAFTLNAQEQYDLQRCLETGLERNYEIRIIRNEERISSNNVTWGNAGFLPSLNLNAAHAGTDNSHETTAGLNIEWTVFDGLQMQTNYKRLKQFHSIGEFNTQIAIENLLANLTAEYYNHVNQNLRLANLKYAVSLSKERMRIAAEKYYIGSESRLDMLQARVDFNADSSSLLKQYEVVQTSAINLNRMMAVDNVSQKITVTDSVIMLNPTLSGDELRKAMHHANSTLLLAAINRKVSELDLRALKGRNYPYLKLNAGYGYTLNTNISDTPKQQDRGFTYGFTLGFNIFDGLNRQREQKNAAITSENRQLQYKQTEQSLDADLSSMLTAYRNNLDLIRLETENLQSARENYEIAIDRYRLGTLAGIELREAQNSLLNAEERLLQAQFSTKLCEISLMQISGQVSAYIVAH
ncbi:MAG: TolC family protein [Dysgonamonadaceae bacterium]|jgi:outer membrane protein TolC|nr:TolC family protein [Dysgonamonadaceae bacterium]